MMLAWIGHTLQDGIKLEQLIKKLQKSGADHGRPTFTLIAVITFFASPVSAAAATPPAETLFTADLLGKLVISLILVLIAQAFIPAIRAWHSNWKHTKAYKAYLAVHVDNTLQSYGREATWETVRKEHIAAPHTATWMDLLKKHQMGVPEVLIAFHNAIHDARSEESLNAQHIPFLSYFGLPPSSVDHESPIWHLDRELSEAVAAYLITQNQIHSALAAQYEPQFFELIQSSEISRRQQWCDAGLAIVEDMTEHYVSTKKLAAKLNTVGTAS